MASIFGTVLLAVLFVGGSAWSQADTESDLRPQVERKRHKEKTSEQQSEKAGQEKIVGHCTVLAGSSNPLEGPCIDLVLVLTNKEGKESIKSRTDKNGLFVFEITKGQVYNLTAGSKFFEVASPKVALVGGASVEVKLKQK